MREREKKFDTSFHLGKLPKYDPLLDRNLRHHFENPRLQRQLHRMGLVRRPAPPGCAFPAAMQAVGPAHVAVRRPAERAVTLAPPPQIDREGRVIDMEKYKSKIVIIEQEFRRAEEAEQKRIKEEEEMRVRALACAGMPQRRWQVPPPPSHCASYPTGARAEEALRRARPPASHGAAAADQGGPPDSAGHAARHPRVQERGCGEPLLRRLGRRRRASPSRPPRPSDVTPSRLRLWLCPLPLPRRSPPLARRRTTLSSLPATRARMSRERGRRKLGGGPATTRRTRSVLAVGAVQCRSVPAQGQEEPPITSSLGPPSTLCAWWPELPRHTLYFWWWHAAPTPALRPTVPYGREPQPSLPSQAPHSMLLFRLNTMSSPAARVKVRWE